LIYYRQEDIKNMFILNLIKIRTFINCKHGNNLENKKGDELFCNKYDNNTSNAIET